MTMCMQILSLLFFLSLTFKNDGIITKLDGLSLAVRVRMMLADLHVRSWKEWMSCQSSKFWSFYLEFSSLNHRNLDLDSFRSVNSNLKRKKIDKKEFCIAHEVIK